MVSIFFQIVFKLVGVLIYLFIVHRWKKQFSIVNLLGAFSISNIILNGCCYILHLYDKTKYPLSDDTLNVLFEAMIVMAIFMILSFKKDILESGSGSEKVA